MIDAGFSLMVGCEKQFQKKVAKKNDNWSVHFNRNSQCIILCFFSKKEFKNAVDWGQTSSKGVRIMYHPSYKRWSPASDDKHWLLLCSKLQHQDAFDVALRYADNLRNQSVDKQTPEHLEKMQEILTEWFRLRIELKNHLVSLINFFSAPWM